MRLEQNEYCICEYTDDSTINISKSVLEKWRDHYLRVAEECAKEPYKWGLYIGKADVLIDLLKHFDDEIPL